VAATTDARHGRVRQPPSEVEALLPSLDTDDALEVAHHRRERMRADDRADAVVGCLDVGDPVAEGLVGGVLQRLRAGADRYDLGAKEPHTGDVERLSARVLLAHVDGAVKTEQRSRGRRGDTVLTRARLSNDAL